MTKRIFEDIDFLPQTNDGLNEGRKKRRLCDNIIIDGNFEVGPGNSSQDGFAVDDIEPVCDETELDGRMSNSGEAEHARTLQLTADCHVVQLNQNSGRTVSQLAESASMSNPQHAASPQHTKQMDAYHDIG